MKSMKALIVFLTIIAIGLYSIPTYSEESEDDTEVAVELTEEELAEMEVETNEIVDEEIAEVTEIDIPKDTLARIKMAQSNIDKWYRTFEIVEYKCQIALSNLNMAKLEMKRLTGIRDAEFKLFLMYNDSCDIKYNEVKDWELRGNRAIKK